MGGFNLSSLSSLASGTGLDVTAVVDQIIATESQPVVLLKNQLTRLTAQQAALTTFNTGLSALLGSVNALKDITGALTGITATSSQPLLLSANADASATPAVHNIVINNLASNSSYVSGALATGATTFSQGTFQLSIGGAAPTTITVDGTNNTLTGLAASINQQNLGVQASVIVDANGSRLALLSSSSGLPGDLAISNNSTGIALSPTAAGINASIIVDGVPVSSATNTVTGVLSGVTLNLAGAAPGSPVQLTVQADTNRAKQAINDFVTSYNSIITAINAQFTFDPIANSAGVLSSDGDLRRLQQQLLGDVTLSVSGNANFNNLASLGVNLNNDGTLTVDDGALGSALQNHYADVKSFFQAGSPSGFAVQVSSDLTSLTDSTQGLINLDLTGNRNTQQFINNSISDFQVRLDARRAQLVTQYSQVDATLRAFPLLQAQITGALNSIPGAFQTK